MKELLDKLSSYHLFNYLLPGTVFVAVARRVSSHTLKQDNIVVELFLYYFIGLVISRIGSLVVEPVFKNSKLVNYAPYTDYVRACPLDPKIEALLEQNNTYRSLCALFLAVVGLKTFDFTVWVFAIPRGVSTTVIFVALFFMFAFAYRKQTNYVKQRVEVALK